MSNRSYDNRVFGTAVSILLGLSVLALFLVFVDYSNLKKEKDALEKAPMESISLDNKEIQLILDTIEDYYLVNKKDTRLIRTIKLDKTKVDTIIIKHGK